MPKLMRKEDRVSEIMVIRLKLTDKLKIQRLAEEDDRTESYMLRQLVLEALNTRERG